MTSRRKFFSKCAAFVAGCALGVGAARRSEKWIPNPEWKDARYGLEVMTWDNLPTGERRVKWERVPFDPEKFDTAFVMSDGKLYVMRKDGKLHLV